MRILMTVPSLAREFGGPAAKARALAAALRAEGHDVMLWGPHAKAVEGATALPVALRFHGTPVPRGLHRLPGAVRRAEVVHVLGYRDPVGTAAALWARVAGVPYILEPCGMVRRRLRSVRLKWLFDLTAGRLVVRAARLVVATSTLEAVELAEDGVAPDRIVVRPNGIEMPAPHAPEPRGTLRRELGVPADAPLVLSLGRISGKKGLVPLMECVARLPGVHLLIAGPDGGDGTLAEVAAHRAALAADRIHVRADGLWGPDRARALADADVFCLYSLAENFGAAAAEAAACGVATVVSDQCGAAEWLDDGTVVVPLGEPDRLAAALRRLLHDPAERARLAAAGREAAATLTWEAAAARQSALYRSLLP